MQLVFSERFDRSLRQALAVVQRAKKFEDAHDVWQARVSRDWRFYFRIIDDKYCLVDITAHPK
ncbi:conserved hypothetical protein [Candidatus Sulfopaludibacter sp. SbA4]|nr:conserved hypothetical protein [Candidatus Sulfopaludibacter sp. SbA4]